jgi:hypothetical protein
MGECATEVIVTILRRCAADGTFERTKFPYTLSHYPTLLRSEKFKDIVAADWFDRFRNMPDEPTWNSDKPIDLLHLVVIHNGLMGTTKHLGWDYVDTFLRTAKTSFEIILRNEHLRIPTKLDLKKLGVTTPPPDASDVDVDADMESLSETDDGVGEVMTCQSPPTLDDNQGSFNFLRLGLHTTPMTSVSEFVREIPAPYQPIELVIEGNKSADFPGLLMGDLLGISPSGCNMEGHVLDCPFQLGLNAMTGTHRLEIRRARNAANYYGTSHWRCRVIFDAVSEGYRRRMTEIDYAVSNQFLTFISDPMIGLFREAYDPVLKCPRVFTPEVRAITWIMLETSSRKRPGRWEAIFRNPHNPSTKRGPRPHVDSVCSFHPIYPNIDKIGDDDGPRYRLRLAQFGEYCGRVIAHGCGLGSPAHPIQLSESLVSASAFQEGLGRTCNVASLLRLFEVRELGTLLASRQRWYPGDLL